MRRLLSIVFTITLITSASASQFHVTTSGSDSNTGSSLFDAFRTIHHALAVADTTPGKPHTVIIGKGTWTREQDPYPLAIPSGIAVVGDGMGETILDASGVATNLITIAGDTAVQISQLSLRNGSTPQGGGIIIGQSAHDILLDRIEVSNCEATVLPGKLAASSNGIGGGLLIVNATNVSLTNCLFRDNESENEGGAIAVVNSSPVLSNLTISDNASYYFPESSAISASGSGTTTVTNSIIWGNPDHSGEYTSVSGNVTLSYSLVEQAGSAIVGTGLVWDDPLFEDRIANDFHLLVGSLGVDGGDPLSAVGAEPAPNGDLINLGAYGGTEEATISGATFTLDRNSLYFLGLPVSPASTSPQDLFGDDFGTPMSDSTWIIGGHYIFEEDDGVSPSTDNHQLTISTDGLTLGSGFFLRQRQASRITVTVGGHALSQQETFTCLMGDLIVMDYDHQITFASNPFPYPIHLQHTKIDGNSFTDELVMEWGLVMNPNGRYVPTYTVIEPWQGVLFYGFSLNAEEWQVPPDRDLTTISNPLAALDWVLQVDFASNPDADTTAIDNGHFFGLGANSSDGPDVHDAPDMVAVNSIFRARSTHDSVLELFHDFQASTRTDKPVWSWLITGDASLPDTIEITFTGIDTSEGSEYPGNGVTLFAAIGEHLNEPEPVPDFSLQDQFSFRIPFPVGYGTTRVTTLTVWADSEGWQWNSVEEASGTLLPQQFTIESIYPNPFNPATEISVALPQRSPLSVTVYDVLGREVVRLASGVQNAGVHRLNFDGSNIASGVYFVRAVSGSQVDVRKMVLLR